MATDEEIDKHFEEPPRCACGSPERVAGGRNCLKCHAAYMREWRKTHRLAGDARAKMNARAYLHVYIKRGKIQKQPCETCGGPAQAHHADYSKPLEVTWLCRKHHLQLHSNKHNDFFHSNSALKV